MGESWIGDGAPGDGNEAGIRGLVLTLRAESLGDSATPVAQWFTAGCPTAIPARTGGTWWLRGSVGILQS